MNDELNARFEEVIAGKIEELAAMELNDQQHGKASTDIKKLIDAHAAIEKVNVEYVLKDDARVVEKEKLELEKQKFEAQQQIEKEKLELERKKLTAEESERNFRTMLENRRLDQEKRQHRTDTILKSIGMAGTGAAFIATLHFEKTGNIVSKAGKAVVDGIIRGFSKLKI